MPYAVQRRKGKWVVVNRETGRVLGTHDSKEKAERQIRAIGVSKHGS